MAREVNVYFDSWQATGQNVLVPQYSVNMTVQWIDNNGVSHSHIEIVKFPNALTGLTVAEQKRLAIEVMLQELRERLQVDNQ